MMISNDDGDVLVPGGFAAPCLLLCRRLPSATAPSAHMHMHTQSHTHFAVCVCACLQVMESYEVELDGKVHQVRVVQCCRTCILQWFGLHFAAVLGGRARSCGVTRFVSAACA
jgi:hypothetical protein